MSSLPQTKYFCLSSKGSGGNKDFFETSKEEFSVETTKGSFNLWYPYSFCSGGTFVSKNGELCATSIFIPFAIPVATQNSQQALPASAK